jgi:serine/threonine protein kinase
MVVSHVMDHTGPSNDDPDTKSERNANIDTSHLGPLTHWKTYIITEFCIGGSLRDILRQPNMVAATKQVRSSAAQLCIAAQVVEGMTYLHSIGVVHNDLKASNVMLHPSGEMHCRWSAKIGDFGKFILILVCAIGMTSCFVYRHRSADASGSDPGANGRHERHGVAHGPGAAAG